MCSVVWDESGTYIQHIYICKFTYTCENIYGYAYWVATVSRLLKIIGLFCKRALYKRRYSAKETYNFKESTNRSHPIALLALLEQLTFGYINIHEYIYIHVYVYICIYLCIYMYIFIFMFMYI